MRNIFHKIQEKGREKEDTAVVLHVKSGVLFRILALHLQEGNCVGRVKRTTYKQNCSKSIT